MPLENKRARRGRGEASIFQHESDGRWVASLSLGFDADGKRKRKTVYGSTKKQVQDELRKIQIQAATGQHSASRDDDCCGGSSMTGSMR